VQLACVKVLEEAVQRSLSDQQGCAQSWGSLACTACQSSNRILQTRIVIADPILKCWYKETDWLCTDDLAAQNSITVEEQSDLFAFPSNSLSLFPLFHPVSQIVIWA